MKWLRISLRTIASVCFVLSIVLVLILTIVLVSCTRHAPPIYSPDGRHVAVLGYAMQGALGENYATVDIRPRWIPWAANVYSGLGNWDFKNDKPRDPEVRWLNNADLLIRYYDDRTLGGGRGGPAICIDRIGDIKIVCESIGFRK